MNQSVLQTILDEGTTICTKRECQPLPPNCPLEAISTDESGCCQVCNLPENLETCSLSQQKTVSPLDLEIPLKGHLGCKNSEVITNWGTCNGSCQSGYRYNTGELKRNLTIIINYFYLRYPSIQEWLPLLPSFRLQETLCSSELHRWTHCSDRDLGSIWMWMSPVQHKSLFWQ